ncbi:MAG TPA: ATP-dependent DNA helicase UvrD2 [Nocardioidaceae bacterium]|nr:ATP-dependent DNA helicase UvrD2 [Nocardioidaceae bacterium]
MTDAEELLDGLDPEQRDVALALDGPVRVLAGAGTGKTRAITYRVAYGVVSGAMTPPEVLAVTFTTRAAGELRTRLARLGVHGVQARTFHSAALRQARYFWPRVAGGELPSITGSKVPLLRQVAQRHGLRAELPELRDLAGEIEWAKVSNVVPEAYAQLARAASREIDLGDADEVGRLYDGYEQLKRERQTIDLEDVLLCAASVLDGDERAAAEIRRQYRWFVVDEFQDVSPLQHRLLELWLGDRDDVCVVGDPAQTIYTFAGASDRFLLDFPRKFSGCSTIALTRNYRSTTQVIDVANVVLAGQPGGSAIQLRAQRGDGDTVSLVGYPDEEAEAGAVATAIADAIAGGADPADIAVLARINAQLRPLADELDERGIAFTERGSADFFRRPEIRKAITLLRASLRSSQPATSVVDAVRDVVTALDWTPQPPQGVEKRRVWESLQALLSDAERYGRDHPDDGPPGFVAHLEARAAAEEAPAPEGVTLASLHAAKGLEWPRVHLIGVHEGTMPLVYRDVLSDPAEERRLLYVGITRARDALSISWASARTPGSRSSRLPSRFLDGLVDESARRSDRSAGPRKRRKRGGLTACRVCDRRLTDAQERKLGRCLTCESDYDEAVHDRLREWRREQAATENLPAYCVFTDATMLALAESLPTDEGQLAGVPGIGPAKIGKYGPTILALCAGSSLPDAGQQAPPAAVG